MNTWYRDRLLAAVRIGNVNILKTVATEAAEEFARRERGGKRVDTVVDLIHDDSGDVTRLVDPKRDLTRLVAQ